MLLLHQSSGIHDHALEKLIQAHLYNALGNWIDTGGKGKLHVVAVLRLPSVSL